MINDQFNLSGKPDEKQKTRLEEAERIKKVEKIKAPLDKRKANTMLNHRDHLIEGLKARADKKIDDVVEEEKRKNSLSKAELHIKPPNGADRKAPEQREHFIRTRVRNNLGKKLEEGIGIAAKAENKKIDQFVDGVLNKQREKRLSAETTAKQEFKEKAVEKVEAPLKKEWKKALKPRPRGRSR